MRSTLIPRVLFFAAIALPGFGFCQAYGQAPAQDQGTPAKISFRNSTVTLQSPQEEDLSGGSVQTGADSGIDSLTAQKRKLESELRGAKQRLDAAHKRLDVNTAAGRIEGADQDSQEIKDLEGRIKSGEAQLAQLEDEIRKTIEATAKSVSGSSADRSESASGGSRDGDTLLPGENVELFVKEDQTFNGRYQIRRGGYIILPQVGRIYVADKSTDEAEAAVRKALQSTQLRSATVMLERVEGVDLESGPVIYLAGEFRAPRPYRIPAGTSPSLVSVILSSGGATDRGDLTRVRVMRVAGMKGVVEEVNVQKILDGGGLTSDVRLNDGDVVMIPSTSAVGVYVTGNVRHQGLQRLRRDQKLTAYAAILNAGGFSRFADLKKVYVLREMPDGTKAKIPVNVKDIQRGAQPDLPLVANDIIVIPEKFFSF